MKTNIYLLTAILLTSMTIVSVERTPDAFKDVGIIEKINQKAFLSIPVQSQNGHIQNLKDLINPNKPIVLNFAYYRCPMLCQLLLTGIRNSVLASKSLFLGKHYQIITLSMAKEDSTNDLIKFRNQYTDGLSEFAKKNWHFLITDEKNRRLITDSVGFKYKYIKETDDYAHQSGLIFLETDGSIKRYIYGISFNEPTLQKALIESKHNEKRSFVEKTLMFCYLYDPERNSYVIHANNIMKIVALLSMTILLGTITKLFYDEHKKKSIL